LKVSVEVKKGKRGVFDKFAKALYECDIVYTAPNAERLKSLAEVLIEKAVVKLAEVLVVKASSMRSVSRRSLQF
jgi:hypothetical protein